MYNVCSFPLWPSPPPSLSHQQEGEPGPGQGFFLSKLSLAAVACSGVRLCVSVKCLETRHFISNYQISNCSSLRLISQMMWLGHLTRCLHGVAFRTPPSGRRPPGRPRTCSKVYGSWLAWENLRTTLCPNPMLKNIIIVFK